MKKKEKKKIVVPLSVEKDAIKKETFKIKKNKLYKLLIDEEKYGIKIKDYDIKVEDEEVCILEDDLSFKFKQYGETKIFFVHKETKDFSYITLQASFPLIPIFLILLLISIWITIGGDTRNTPPGEDKDNNIDINEYKNDEKLPNHSSQSGVIIFPSNITTIGISSTKPCFKFQNSGRNRVFFHYYIYNKKTGNTIDIGQVAPGEVLEVDVAQYFEYGTTNVRIDILTFKDTSETKERNSMSFNGVVIKK